MWLARLTGNKTGDDQRQDEHVEHPKQNLAWEGHQHDDVITWISRPPCEPDDCAQKDS